MIPLALNGVEALTALLRFERQFTVKKLRADLDVRAPPTFRCSRWSLQF